MVMSTMSQIGMGRRRQPVRPTYNTFKPRSDWNKTAGSTFLHVYLSGFTREQVKVTWEASRGLIRVQGQRPIATNRWTRFDEFFKVPESCDASKLKTAFFHGLLTVELPIVSTITEPDQTEKDKTKPVQGEQSTAEPGKEPLRHEIQRNTGEDDRTELKTENGKEGESGKEPSGIEIQENRGENKKTELEIEKGKEIEFGKEPSGIEIQKNRGENKKTELEIEKEKEIEFGEEPWKHEIQTNRDEIDKNEMKSGKRKEIESGKEPWRHEIQTIRGEDGKTELRIGKGGEETSREFDLSVDKDRKIGEIGEKCGIETDGMKGNDEKEKRGIGIEKKNEEANCCVNVVSATLVIMGFGAYLYGRFLKFIS